MVEKNVSEVIEIEGVTYVLDHNGYLANREEWTPAFAEAMAQRDNTVLGEEHWQIIEFLREYEAQTRVSPAMRVLIKALKSVLGEEKANSRYLYRLFPYGPAKQASKYAGLPKPPHCV